MTKKSFGVASLCSLALIALAVYFAQPYRSKSNSSSGEQVAKNQQATQQVYTVESTVVGGFNKPKQ